MGVVMDDLTHDCPDCHEITRTPAQHTCGRTPEGTLPGHQPHKAQAPAGLVDLLLMLKHAVLEAGTVRKSDFTLAGPSKGDSA